MFHHLEVGSGTTTERVFGDRGDGFFNYFILEHVRSFFLGKTDSLSGTQLFWPDHQQTLWWSDNLLLPGALYTVLSFITTTPAFVSGVIWVLLGFGFTVMLLKETLRALSPEQTSVSGWQQFLIVVLAFLSTFSLARLLSYTHYQNFASVLIIAQILFALRYLREQKLRDVVAVVGLETALLYFSPYQAMLGIVILSAWAFCICAHPELRPWQLLRRQGPWLTPFLIPAGWIFWMYSQAEPLEYSLSEVALRSARVGNFLRPPDARVFPDLFPRTFPGGYLGCGLLLFAAGVLVTLLWTHRDRIRSQPSRRWLLSWFFLVALSFVDAREIKGVLVWIRLLVLLFPLAGLFFMIRRENIQKNRIPIVFLILSCVLVFGVSLGPSMNFQHQALDPGIWGWYQHLVPGFGSMRELIRFVPTAQVLLIVCLFGVASIAYRQNKMWIVLGILSVGVQAWEQRDAHPVVTPITENQRLSEMEYDAFSSLEGSMLVIPTAPFDRNTRYLLMWQSVQDLVLVNGYSGRSTNTFDRFMELEREQGRASQEVIDLARSLGVEYLCLYRPHVEPSAQETLLDLLPLQFSSERFLVFLLHP